MSMRDIDLVIAEVKRIAPNIRSTQLQVKHPGVDLNVRATRNSAQ